MIRCSSPDALSRHSHQRQNVIKKFDHRAIYLLIAEPTAAFLLVGLISVSARVDDCYLSLALLGILFKLDHRAPICTLSLVTHLAMAGCRWW